jgi:glycosyltransferase involved in cell wall biosynthesis
MKKKILVRGPALSQTGYGEQCRFALRALRSREDLFDIYLMNVPWGGTNWIFEDSEERRWLDELIIKTKPLLEYQKQNPQIPSFDISLQVTIPNELQRIAPQNILYTAGIETDKACTEWIAKCHQFADRILVISEHAKRGLQTLVKAQDQMGNELDFVLEKPIEVVHYPVKDVVTKDLDLNLETEFNFLTIAQWGLRKNLPNTITWFCEEFHDDENVGLIVKTFMKGNSQIDKTFVNNALTEIASKFPNKKCKVYFLHGYMNEQEIHSLYTHPKIKAMLNFGHGEGFGLPLFEAAYSGLPVITHDFGGQKDFLYAPKKDKKGVDKLRAHFSKVNHELKPVQKEVLWKGVIEPDMQWAYPVKSSCKVAMREAVKNYGLLQGEAKRLKGWLEQEFEESIKYESFITAIDIENENSNWLDEIVNIVKDYE